MKRDPWRFSASIRPVGSLLVLCALVGAAALLGLFGHGRPIVTAAPFTTSANVTLNSTETCAGRPTSTPLPQVSVSLQITMIPASGSGTGTIQVKPATGFFFGYGGGQATGDYYSWSDLVASVVNEQWNFKYNSGDRSLAAGASGAFYRLHYTDPGLGACDVTSTGSGTVADPLPPIMMSYGWSLYVEPGGQHGACSQDAPCATLQQAWTRVLGNPIDVTIFLGPGTYSGLGSPIVLNVPDGINAAITGAGSYATLYDGGGTNSGLQIGGSGTLALRDFRIANVRGPLGAIVKSGSGVLDMSGMALKDNTSLGDGGSLAITGGVANLDAVLFGRNRASEYGGAIYVGPGATLNGRNLTVLGNFAGEGGAGAATNGGTMYVSSSTFLDNRGSYVIGQDYDRPDANQAPANVTVTNTIVGGGGTAPACSEPVTSGGHNLEADDSCGLRSTGDLVNTDPRIAAFDFYGGGVQTLAFYSDSPALDGGGPTCPATDGRGASRPQGAACDIGAFESQAAKADLVVVSASASDSTPATGATTTLTVIVRNDGAAANGAGVRIDLSGLELVAATPGKGQVGTAARQPYWLIGALAPGEQATLTLSVKNLAHARASATFSARAFERNATPGNNTGTVTLNAVLPQVIAIAVASDQ